MHSSSCMYVSIRPHSALRTIAAVAQRLAISQSPSPNRNARSNRRCANNGLAFDSPPVAATFAFIAASTSLALLVNWIDLPCSEQWQRLRAREQSVRLQGSTTAAPMPINHNPPAPHNNNNTYRCTCVLAHTLRTLNPQRAAFGSMGTDTKQPDHHACLCDEEATQLPSSFLRLFCFCFCACIITDQQQKASVKSARTSASNNRHAGNLNQQIATSSPSYAPMSRYLSNRIPLLHTAYPDPCQLLSHQLREVQVPVLTNYCHLFYLRTVQG